MLDNVIELSAFNDAFIPETASLILAVKSAYDVAMATVSPLIVKVADCEKVPLTRDESELNASASAPCMPVLAFIASANNLASLAPEAEVSD